MFTRALSVMFVWWVAIASVSADNGKMSKPEVKLLDAGHGPKHKLRMKVAPGTKQTLVMTMKMEMAMDAGPALHVPRTALPAAKMKATVTVVDVNKAGDARYEFVMDGFDVVDDKSAQPTVIAAMRKALDNMKGFKGTATVDARNFTIAAAFDVPPTVDASTKQMLDGLSQSFAQLSCPLPDEAVGVGARWRVKALLPVNGVSLHQTAEYEITSLDGDNVQAKVTLMQKADPQPMSSATLPPGTKVSIVSWGGKGEGALSLAPTAKLLPTQATISLATDAKMDIAVDTTHQPMTMFLAVGFDIE